MLSVGFAKSDREVDRCVRRSRILALVHVPQLVSSEDDTGNDSSLNEGSDDRNSIASHSGALQSAEERANTGGWLSGSGKRSCGHIN